MDAHVIPIPETAGRRDLAGKAIQGLVETLSRGLKPLMKGKLNGISVTRNVSYLPTGKTEHLLDIYRPEKTNNSGKLPVVLFLHGGGFTIGSKETHWIFGAQFAQAGYLTLVPNYRLAPENPFPAALEDAAAVWLWLVKNVTQLGGDINRIVIGGESAGANLSLNVVLAAIQQREEGFLKPVFEAGVVPKGMWLGCGFFNLSRLSEDSKHNFLVRNRIRGIVSCYLGAVKMESPKSWELVDPVSVVESDRVFSRPLPKAYLSCGGADPVLNHSQRLAQALLKRESQHTFGIFPGAGHAFQAFVFQKQAQSCWKETIEFLKQEV